MPREILWTGRAEEIGHSGFQEKYPDVEPVWRCASTDLHRYVNGASRLPRMIRAKFQRSPRLEASRWLARRVRKMRKEIGISHFVDYRSSYPAARSNPNDASKWWELLLFSRAQDKTG